MKNKTVKVVFKDSTERVVSARYLQEVLLKVKLLKDLIFTFSYL